MFEIDKDNEQHSEHFINFILNGKKLDFNVFKTREEFDKFNEEVDQYLKENGFK